MLDLISVERLKSYSTVLKISDVDKQLRAYHWNKALCSSIYPAMQCLEITLRNALNSSILKNAPKTNLYDVDNWWFFNICRYMGDKKTRSRKRFDPATGRRMSFLWEELQIEKVRKRFIAKGIAYNYTNILAGMDFGFWTNFLSRSYEDTGSHTLLWPNLLRDVFPNASSATTRADIEYRFNQIREFRNRISHHEPIWKFFYKNPMTNGTDYSSPVYGRSASISLLLKMYNDILETIGWISQERLDYLVRSNLCENFLAICSQEGLNAYISPGDIFAIKHNDPNRNNLIIKKTVQKKIFKIVKNSETIAVFGASIALI